MSADNPITHYPGKGRFTHEWPIPIQDGQVLPHHGSVHAVIFGDGSLYPDSAHSKPGQFAGIHSWEDWHLIATSRPVIAPAEPEQKMITIPGRQGNLDLSEYLTGGPVYKDRTGSLEFIVANGFGEWTRRYQEILDTLHNKRIKMVLEDDPGWYYVGRLKVESWTSDKDWSKVTIGYDLQPFKYHVRDSLDEVVWDTFKFDEDYDYTVVVGLNLANGTRTFTLSGNDGTFIPTATFAEGSSGTATVTFNDSKMTIRGTGDDVEIEGSLSESVKGDNTLTVEGDGIVNIGMRGVSV